MRLFSISTLAAFAAKHATARPSCERLCRALETASWRSTGDVIGAFPSAKVINGERIRFETGNNFRVILSFDFQRQIAWVKFTGTHAEYDRIDAATVSLY